MTRLATLLLLAGVVQDPSGPAVLQPTVGVERVLVDARVLDGGRAVKGLRPEHFRVRIDDDPAELVSVTGISAEGAEALAFADQPEEAPDRTPARGRLVVLEIGLRQVAADTGGFYAKTHDFARLAVNRLEEALEGHYILEVAHPGGPRGRHELDVDLVSRRGQVLARKAYFD